jgi:signal transduction histidine kinase
MLLASINSPRLIRNVVNIGISGSTSPFQEKYILLTNSINLTVLALIPLYSVFFMVLGFKIPGLMLIPVFLLMLIPLCLTAMNYYLTARVLLIGLLNIILGFYALLLGRGSNLHFLYVVFATVPFLLFSFQDFLLLAISWVVSVACFILIRFELIYVTPIAGPEEQTYISISIIALTFIWLTLNFYYLKRANASMARSIIAQNNELQQEVQRRTESENNLLRHVKEVEAKDKELRQLTHIAAHDLQEPLRTITSYTQLLRRQISVEHNPAGETYMQFIQDASLRLKELMSDLLDYYNVTALNHTETIDCNGLVHEVMDEMRDYINDTHAAIYYQNLPTISGNRYYIKVLFTCLLMNSIKFHRNGHAPEVTIHALKDNLNWKFSVSDNGIGIEKKYFDKIFVIFQRLHNHSEYEGTGVGLALCKKIVELHGGKIWVESEVGKGSVFYFTLPGNQA